MGLLIFAMLFGNEVGSGFVGNHVCGGMGK